MTLTPGNCSVERVDLLGNFDPVLIDGVGVVVFPSLEHGSLVRVFFSFLTAMGAGYYISKK